MYMYTGLEIKFQFLMKTSESPAKQYCYAFTATCTYFTTKKKNKQFKQTIIV